MLCISDTSMNLSPELKAQLAEQKKQCVFCKLIAKEIPGKIVFEDAKTMALLDIYPAVKGHTLFLPKEHYPILPYMPEDDFTHFFSLLPSMTKAVKDWSEIKHILQTLWENGVKFCINTDWPEIIKDAHLAKQIDFIAKNNILTQPQLDQTIKWGFQASFVNQHKKSNLYL